MDRTEIDAAVFPNCPIRNIMSKFCDKWSILVFYTLDRSDKDSLRFKDLKQAIPDISEKMLTATLRNLENEGYITRRYYQEIPPRVEYALTDLSRSLIPLLDALIGWSLEHKDTIMAQRSVL